MTVLFGYLTILTQTVFSVHGGNKSSVTLTPTGANNPVTTLQTREWEIITYRAGIIDTGGINVERRPHCRSYCLRAHHKVDCFIRTDVIEDNKSRDDNTSARIFNSKVEPRLVSIESKNFHGYCGSSSSRDLSRQGLYKCIITGVHSSHWIHCRCLIFQQVKCSPAYCAAYRRIWANGLLVFDLYGDML